MFVIHACISCTLRIISTSIVDMLAGRAARLSSQAGCLLTCACSAQKSSVMYQQSISCGALEAVIFHARRLLWLQAASAVPNKGVKTAITLFTLTKILSLSQ